MNDLYLNAGLMLLLFALSISLYLGKNFLTASDVARNRFKGKKWVLIISIIFIVKSIVDFYQS